MEEGVAQHQTFLWTPVLIILVEIILGGFILKTIYDLLVFYWRSFLDRAKSSGGGGRRKKKKRRTPRKKYSSEEEEEEEEEEFDSYSE